MYFFQISKILSTELNLNAFWGFPNTEYALKYHMHVLFCIFLYCTYREIQNDILTILHLKSDRSLLSLNDLNNKTSDKTSIDNRYMNIGNFLMYYSCIKFKDVLVRRFHYVSERFQTLFYPGCAGIVLYTKKVIMFSKKNHSFYRNRSNLFLLHLID